MTIDREVVAVFAALVLLEGLRRVPAGALVVRAFGRGGWEPVDGTEPRARWRLVSWYPPIVRSIVLPPLERPTAPSNGELEARLAVARRAAPWLAAGGAVTQATLIIGLPLATAGLGLSGFLAGVLVVLALAGATAAAGWRTLGRLAPGSGGPRCRVLAWCSPFASGRVVEAVYEEALSGASQAQALRALAGEQVFAEWARPRAYDVLCRGATDGDLALATEPRLLGAMVAAEPRAEAGARSYCPRCGITCSFKSGSCPDCAVALVSLANPEARPVSPVDAASEVS